jgi:Tol biopolymer transport system component
MYELRRNLLPDSCKIFKALLHCTTDLNGSWIVEDLRQVTTQDLDDTAGMFAPLTNSMFPQAYSSAAFRFLRKLWRQIGET